MFFAAGIGFLIGVGLATSLLTGFEPLLLWPLLVALAAVFLTRSYSSKVAVVGIAGVLVGLNVAAWQLHPLPTFTNSQVQVAGVVQSEGVVGSSRQLVVSGLKLDGRPMSGKLSVRERLYPSFRAGDALEFSGKITRPDPLPSGWRAKGIVGQMNYPDAKWVAFHRSWAQPISRLHNWIKEQIQTNLPEPEAGLLNGFLLGDKADISPELNNNLNRTGTTHLIAVSGYNVAIVVAFAWLLRGWMPYRLLIGSSIGLVTGFVLLVGPSASVIRAALMGSIALLAKGFGRPAAAKRLVILVAVIMVAWDPWTLVDDLGFQLSFAATAGIIWLEPLFTPILARAMPTILAGVIGTTFAAQVATEPILIDNFGRLSLISIVTNTLVLPLVPLTMLMGAIELAAGFVFVPFGQAIAWLTWPLLHLIVLMIEWGGRLPGAAIEQLHAPAWMLPLMYAVMIGVLVSVTQLKRRLERAK
jgi:competence protein ComEC